MESIETLLVQAFLEDGLSLTTDTKGQHLIILGPAPLAERLALELRQRLPELLAFMDSTATRLEQSGIFQREAEDTRKMRKALALGNGQVVALPDGNASERPTAKWGEA